MTSDSAGNDPQVLQALIRSKPVIDVLAWLNERADFRFTALGHLADGKLHNLAHFDRLGMPAHLPTTPVSDSYFEFVLAEGEFAVENALRDDRLLKNPYRKLIRSFHGVPLLAAGATAIGVLYHYDVLPRRLLPDQLELLRLAGGWLVPIVAAMG